MHFYAAHSHFLSMLAQLIERRPKALCKCGCWTGAVVVKEDNTRLLTKHVRVDSDHFQVVLAEGPDDRVHFGIEHGDVTGDMGIVPVTGEGGPGVQTDGSRHV